MTSAQAQSIQEEIKAINDVFPEILKREWPGNPVISYEMKDPFKDIKRELAITDSLKGCVNRLYIVDTLKSLVQILKSDKWLIEDDNFTPIYKKLIAINTFAKLMDCKFQTDKIDNTWIYKKIFAIPESREQSYLHVTFSRVCFNKNKDLGFFYVSVLESGMTGYSTLVLLEKHRKTDKWKLVSGTFFH